MLSSNLKILNQVIKGFAGKNHEPGNATEAYVLKSMWVMLMSQFEASIKDSVESYIDKVKKKKTMDQMHVCFLLQNFYGQKEDEELTVSKILALYNKPKKDITYINFTKNKKAKYKYEHVKKLFNSLGIFFTKKDDVKIKLLDGIASTRDSIAHGDHSISITAQQLKDDIKIVNSVFKTLEKKLRV